MVLKSRRIVKLNDSFSGYIDSPCEADTCDQDNSMPDIFHLQGDTLYFIVRLFLPCLNLPLEFQQV